MIPRSYLFRDQAALAAGLSSVQPAELTLTSEYEPARDPVGDDGAISASPPLRVAEEDVAMVWRLLRRLGVPESDVDDATQDVLLTAHRNRHRIDAGKERSFLFGAALRVVRKYRARPAPPAELDENLVPSGAPSLDETLDQRRARALVERFLAELPLDLRAVFVLFELEDMSTAAIAEGLEIPQGTVASRLRRARKLFHAKVARLRARQTGGGGT